MALATFYLSTSRGKPQVYILKKCFKVPRGSSYRKKKMNLEF